MPFLQISTKLQHSTSYPMLNTSIVLKGTKHIVQLQILQGVSGV